MNIDCIISHWKVDTSSSSLIHQQSGEQRRLGEYQLRLLLVLAQHAGQILTRDELNTLVWERRVIGSNSLPNAIHALRVALDDSGKQQLIIRTIPRKGYILEAEYCHFIQHESADDRASEQSGAEPEALAVVPVKTLVPVLAETAPDTPRKRGYLMFSLQLLVVIALSVALFHPYTRPAVSLQELHKGVWSQIRIFQLSHTQRTADSSRENFNTLLGPAFYRLNQQLEQRRVRMDIYYAAAGNTLNYTLKLISRCQRRELAMTVYYWRLDSQKLNNLIVQETERKLNEMADCNPKSDAAQRRAGAA